MPNYGFDVRWSPADGEYVALCPSFPGLSALGATPEDALAEARDALSLYVEEYEADGVPLPSAVEAGTYSGQTRLRLPKSLHAAAARQAEAEGVSLNTLLVGYIASHLGAAHAERAVADRVCAEVGRVGRRIESRLAALTDDVGGNLAVLHGQMQRIEATQSTYVATLDDGDGVQDPVLRRIQGRADH